MVFKSKVDSWLAAVVFGIVIAVIIAFNTWLFRNTDYRIENETLHIRSAFIRWNVPIRDIVSVVPTRSALSSPALSLDRLQITWRKSGGEGIILVSPEDQRGFLEALRRVNPAIA